ncbi:hypothetical protein DB346_21940 [Verrucomicrobia bacterium LW23]|nr:hypothetical protein DB346_21940 [Verrucomicrobia bacterium LW23]
MDISPVHVEFDLPGEVFNALESIASKRNLRVHEFVREMCTHAIAEGEDCPQPDGQAPVRSPLPVFPFLADKKLRPLTNAELQEILLQEEVENALRFS